MSQMSVAKEIVKTKATIADCESWIASYEKIIAEGNPDTVRFDIYRRDSWRDMRAESVKQLAKLEMM